LIDINKQTTDAGNRAALRAKAIVVPSEGQFDIARILKNVNRPGTADRDINAIVATGALSLTPIVNNFLTDPDAWFILVDGVGKNCGLRHFQHGGIKAGTDNEFTTGNVRVKATEKYSFGWSNWRAIHGTQGA
jgi:hypothetical protein